MTGSFHSISSNMTCNGWTTNVIQRVSSFFFEEERQDRSWDRGWPTTINGTSGQHEKNPRVLLQEFYKTNRAKQHAHLSPLALPPPTTQKKCITILT